MASGKRSARRSASDDNRGVVRTRGRAAIAQVPHSRPEHALALMPVAAESVSVLPRTQRRARPRPMKDPPAIAPCLGLDALRALSLEAAREHVDAYLHAVMAVEDADDFEARAYRWELHLVDVEHMRLVSGVDLDAKKLRSYRMRLARGGGFPPLVGLGGEGKRVTEGVLLCDGYHRAVAIRNAGIPFVWTWLAVDMWRGADARPVIAAGVGIGAGA